MEGAGEERVCVCVCVCTVRECIGTLYVRVFVRAHIVCVCVCVCVLCYASSDSVWLC